MVSAYLLAYIHVHVDQQFSLCNSAIHRICWIKFVSIKMSTYSKLYTKPLDGLENCSSEA